ncbi:hypothetical protein STANM309S_04565 [Streptomyces tanashiensis]
MTTRSSRPETGPVSWTAVTAAAVAAGARGGGRAPRWRAILAGAFRGDDLVPGLGPWAVEVLDLVRRHRAGSGGGRRGRSGRVRAGEQGGGRDDGADGGDSKRVRGDPFPGTTTSLKC